MRLEFPPARYAQWRAVLHAGTTAPGVDSVALNYLPKNVAPEIDDVTVQVGVKYQPLPRMPQASAWGRIRRRYLQEHISKPHRPVRMIAIPLE